MAFGLDDRLLLLHLGLGQLGVGFVFHDADLHLRVRQIFLTIGRRGGFFERPPLLGSRFLLLERFDLFSRELTLAKLLQQGLDLATIGRARLGLADENVDAFQIELLETLAKLLTRLCLDFVALTKQFKHRTFVAYIAEIGGASIGSMLWLISFFTSPNRCTTPGGFLIIDMHDQAERQDGARTHRASRGRSIGDFRRTCATAQFCR